MDADVAECARKEASGDRKVRRRGVRDLGLVKEAGGAQKLVTVEGVLLSTIMTSWLVEVIV